MKGLSRQLPTVLRSLSQAIGEYGDTTGALTDDSWSGKALKAVISHLNTVRNVAITCGIISAVCVVILIAINYSISANPISRNQMKSRIIALAIGAIALGAASAICVLMYNIGKEIAG